MPPPGTLSWALKSKFCGGTVAQKESSHAMVLIKKKKKKIIKSWAKEHDTNWVYHILYDIPASGKIKWLNGLIKTTLEHIGIGMQI